MSDFGPLPLPPLPSFLGGGSAAPPIVPNLPEVETAFTNKYQEIAPALQQFPTHIANSLVNFDLRRVARGQAPLSRQATALALMAARTGQAQTQPADPEPTNVIGNLTRNLREITTAIPRIPAALYREAQELPDAPAAISQALASGSPGEMIAGIASAPGVRLLPGAYIAGNLAQGSEGARELATNPLMTFLDVLPGVQKAAARTPLYRALEQQTAAIRAGGQFAPEIRPLRAIATRRVDATGAVVPNTLGELGQALARTRPAQVVTEAFGQQARAASRIAGSEEIEYRNLINPEGLPNTDPTVFATRAAQGLDGKYGLTPERAAEISDLVQFDPARIPDLTDAERAYVGEYRELLARVQDDPLVSQGPDALREIGGELYDSTTGRRLQTLQTRLSSRTARITNDVLPRLDDVIRAEQLNGPVDPRLTNLRDALAAGNWRDAHVIFNGLQRGQTRLAVPQGVKRGRSIPLSRVAPANQRLASIANMRRDIRDVLAARTTLDRAMESAVPARFQPLIGKRAADRYVKRQAARGVVQVASPDEAAAMAQAILNRQLADLPGWDAKEFRNTVDEVRRTWQDMRDVEGLDPIFVHRVTGSRAEAARYSGVLETIPSLSQTKSRVADISPSVRNLGVSLSHQGMEVLARRVSENYIRQMIDTFGVDEASLARRYAPAAQVASTADPRLSYSEHLKRMIEADYTRYDPRAVISWSTNRFADLDLDNTYIPRTVANNIKRSHNPSTYRLSSVLDPITGAFRTSLLPLSPRWHAYNILGGGIMLGARSGISAFGKLGQSRRLLKALDAGDMATIEAALPRELVVSLGGAVREMQELKFRTRSATRDASHALSRYIPELHFRSGATLGRIFNQITTKSFAANQLVDDMYRVTAYLYGHDKAITKGLSKQASERAGIELARKILQQWDEYTPIERQVLRHVFPFYGFTQHLLRYTFKYPFDHPFRAAVMSAISRNEIEDLGTGLPTSFLNSFFFGSPDDQGNITALSLQGLNPFEDTANMMTLAGWASATNPVLATVFEQMGIEGGTLELYPDLRYDPSTGQLVAQHQSPLMNLVTNIVPQTQLLTALLGTSGEFKELLRTNPDAAMRQLRTQAGLPVLFRNYDLPAEYFRAEVARQEAQTDAKNAALKSGVDDEAMRYPGLRALIEQIRELQSSGQMTDFTPSYTPPAPERERGPTAIPLGPLPIGR